MTIYPNMNKEERNRILQSRYSLLGIPEQYSPDGRLLYIPDLEDKMLYYENCEMGMIVEWRFVSLFLQKFVLLYFSFRCN